MRLQDDRAIKHNFTKNIDARAFTWQLLEALLLHQLERSSFLLARELPQSKLPTRIASQKQLHLALATSQHIRHHRCALERLKNMYMY